MASRLAEVRAAEESAAPHHRPWRSAEATPGEDRRWRAWHGRNRPPAHGCLPGLGRGLGRLRGRLIAHGCLNLLLASQGGHELVGVLERPANQRLGISGPRPRGGPCGAQFGRPGRSAVDQLLEAGQDAPLLALLQPALGELERRRVPGRPPGR
jgi:hypothetical protein